MANAVRKWHWLRVGGFLAFIATPSVDMLFRVDDTVLGDEASLQVDLAVHDLDSLKTLPGRIRHYLHGTFGFRGAVVRAHGHMKVHGLGVSSSPKVLLGEDGWLFLASEFALDDYRRLRPLSTRLLSRHREVLAERKAWVEQRGARYVFFCAPNKHTIYPQYMPKHLKPGVGPSWIDQLVEAAPGLVVDVRPALLAEATRTRLYHRTDTHWNQLGGLVAAGVVARELSKTHPGLPSLEVAHVTSEPVTTPGGDLARILGLKFDVHEESWSLHFAHDAEIMDGGKPLVVEPIDVQNTAMVRILNRHAPLGKAVVFRDSFGEMLKQPFAQLFRESLWVWTDEFDPALVEAERPDFVIQELVERRLATHEPKTIDQARAQRQSR